jgi:hypothetical protein
LLEGSLAGPSLCLRGRQLQPTARPPPFFLDPFLILGQRDCAPETGPLKYRPCPRPLCRRIDNNSTFYWEANNDRSNIANFTDTRKSPPVVDLQELAAPFEKYKQMIEKREVIGAALVCVTPRQENDHIPLMEFLCLPGASPFKLIGGLHILSTELCIDRMIEMKFGEFLEKVTP